MTETLPLPTAPTSPPRNDRLWVVLVNFNGLDDTRKCLRSLADVPDAVSVVVVDNASKENAVPILQREFPWADFVRSEVNGGWAGGNNLGVQHALARGAEWAILLNNDTVVPPRFVRRLTEAAEAFPNYGVLGPVILFMDEPTKVQTTGVVFNRPDRDGFFQPIDVPHDAEGRVGVVECDIVNGCCLMIRRDVVEKIGLVDEAFFLIHEESDWCLRAQAVTKCGIVADAIVWHKGSSSFQREGKKLQRYYDARNLVRLLRKHRNRPTARRFLKGFRHYLGYAFHRYAHERGRGFRDSADAVLEGVYDGLTGRYGPRQDRWRPGLGLLRMAAGLVWRVKK
ncbi:glycosyltransferase family 2 protein [Limnoglobus roseus]|uniref:GT2 family glycosyltransferase n=1 Tax=Limnoglobus roseus TaxID=2598579 RepID=A0A5C1ASF1_9BACT|nr:glycosyltransferase family 2 protein [Limnoglobus roseus]QEL21023.1 GT2 family glycosyltransferase [Limnoglobus roseus]